MKTHKKKTCKCWSCKLTPKIREFEKSLNTQQTIAFEEFFNEVWDRMEATEMDLGVLESKIEGTWPGEQPGEEGFYHRIGETLYWITKPTKV